MWSGSAAPSTVTVPSIEADAPGTCPVASAASASAEPDTSVVSSPPPESTSPSPDTTAPAQTAAITRKRVTWSRFPPDAGRKLDRAVRRDVLRDRRPRVRRLGGLRPALLVRAGRADPLQARSAHVDQLPVARTVLASGPEAPLGLVGVAASGLDGCLVLGHEPTITQNAPAIGRGVRNPICATKRLSGLVQRRQLAALGKPRQRVLLDLAHPLG